MWNQKRVPSTLPQAKKTWSSSDRVRPAYDEQARGSSTSRPPLLHICLAIGAQECLTCFVQRCF